MFFGFQLVRLIIKDSVKKPGEKQVMGFVEFTSVAFATAAMGTLQGYPIDLEVAEGPVLRLSYAWPAKNDARRPPPRGRGGDRDREYAGGPGRGGGRHGPGDREPMGDRGRPGAGMGPGPGRGGPRGPPGDREFSRGRPGDRPRESGFDDRGRVSGWDDRGYGGGRGRGRGRG